MKESGEQRRAPAAASAAEALRLHALYRGKVQVLPKCPVRGLEDFAVWYTPGVAEPCRAIRADPDDVWKYTNRANTVAIVSDGSRILGLGNIGPEAGLPVMEGKALLYKFLGGVDAVPICLGTQDPDEIVRSVELLAPSFGGVNLEDIEQPKCFRVLDILRRRLDIPVWHDDQQGSATVLLAALANALEIVGKRLDGVRIAMIGMGAANVATYRLITARGADPAGIIACDTTGTLHGGRVDLEEKQEEYRDKWRVCTETNPESIVGGIPEALRGADVCIAFSSPGPEVVRPEWVREMADDAIVFACANPVPEIWPWVAREAGARIVASGRSDFPNQVNNSLGFPGIFRGVLDVRARTITDEMALAAADALAAHGREQGIDPERLLPTMEDWEVYPRIAVATAMKAREQGVARLEKAVGEVHDDARRAIRSARDVASALLRAGLIAVEEG